MSVVAMASDGRLTLDLKGEHTVYRVDGQRVPGVTTILGVLDKPALLKWAAETERAGVLDALAHESDLPAKFFYETKRDKAADIGTVAHALAQAFVLDTELDTEALPSEMVAQAQHGVARFIKGWKRDGLTLVHAEYVMQSTTLGCGGTADLIVRCPHRGLGLKDLKTTKPSRFWPYDETFAQVAAYALLYQEQTGERIEWIEIERIGKTEDDEGQVFVVTPENRDAGEDLFHAARLAYFAKRRIAR